MIAGQVQDKIACLFETQFNEQTKENLATGTLRKEISALFNSSNTVKPIVKTTVKMDGTCCLVRNGQLWKRFDKKLNRAGQEENRKLQRLIRNKGKDNVELKFHVKKHYKDTPEGWVAADANAQVIHSDYHNSQHIVGWVPVSSTDRADVWHASTVVDGKELKVLQLSPDNHAQLKVVHIDINAPEIQNKTFELVGPKINGNLYQFPADVNQHFLIGHGSIELPQTEVSKFMTDSNDLSTVDVNKLLDWFKALENPYAQIEGLVWHILHPDDDQVLGIYKVHQHHLGLEWPNTKAITPVLHSYREDWLHEQ